MMSSEVVTSIVVREEDLPNIVNSQMKEIVSLQASVKNAMEKAKQAKESADRARNHSTGVFQKKGAIESLQTATADLAEAQVSATDAQKLSFEYQEKLGKITQKLFWLGASNIAANRTVVRELELKLRGASEEEISDLARQEILNVVKQLKAQEDIMNKQAQLSQKVREHENAIMMQKQVEDEQNKLIARSIEKDEEYDRLIIGQIQKDKEHDRLIKEQAEKDREHDRLLAEQVAKDEEFDKLILEQAEKDKEHDKLLLEQAEKDREHDRLLSEQAEKDKEHDKLLLEQAEKDKEHDKLLLEQAEKDKEHDKLLSEQASENSKQDKLLEEQAELLKDLQERDTECQAKIKELQKMNAELKDMLAENGQEIGLVKKELENINQIKTDKKITYMSIAIAVVSFVIGCIQFLL